jgi:hypothetical protein
MHLLQSGMNRTQDPGPARSRLPGPAAWGAAVSALLAVTLAGLTGRASAAEAPSTAPSPLRVPGPLSPRNASYRIRATLDGPAHRVTGHATLVWRNLEKGAVDHLVFHLYQNAFKNTASQFVRDSGTQLRGVTMPDKGWGYIDVTGLRVGNDDLLPQATVLDTLLTVPLKAPIGPSATLEVEIDWTVQLPKVFARSGWVDDYNAVTQWFPKIGVWDCSETGDHCLWRAHQYRGYTEFFADYGNYDVELDVPADTVIGATGVRVSERLDGKRRIERYRAEDVADFAWFADPRFLVVEQPVSDEFGGITMRLLTRRGQEPVTPRHFAAVAAALQEGERRFGIYPYRNVTVVVPPADGNGSGGMEYPTIITAISAPVPESIRVPEGVTAHEFGHQFLYHLIGSDEVEEAWLDEGLNETFTSWVMERMFPHGCTVLHLPYLCMSDVDNAWLAYRSSTRQAPLKTPSFKLPQHSYGAITYSHTAVMLRTLERYLGAERMTAAMRTYADRSRFRHPHADDFTAAMNAGAGEDLGWFWQQALRTTKVADYQIMRVSSDEHELAAGYWDCPPRFLPTSDLQDRFEGEDSGSQAERQQLAAEASAKVCAGKSPGRYQLALGTKAEPVTYDSEVTVYRRGDFVFPVYIRVRFADGSVADEQWTLSEQLAEPEQRFKVLRYLRRKSKLHSAEVDPTDQLLLDEKRLNNGLLLTADRRPVRRLWLSWQGAVQTLLDLLAL